MLGFWRSAVGPPLHEVRFHRQFGAFADAPRELRIDAIRANGAIDVRVGVLIAGEQAIGEALAVGERTGAVDGELVAEEAGEFERGGILAGELRRLRDHVDRAAGRTGGSENGVGPLHDLDAFVEQWVEIGLEAGIEVVDRAAVVFIAADRLPIEDAAAAGEATVADAGDILRRIVERGSADVFQEIVRDDVDGGRRIHERPTNARRGQRISRTVGISCGPTRP